MAEEKVKKFISFLNKGEKLPTSVVLNTKFGLYLKSGDNVYLVGSKIVPRNDGRTKDIVCTCGQTIHEPVLASQSFIGLLTKEEASKVMGWAGRV